MLFREPILYVRDADDPRLLISAVVDAIVFFVALMELSESVELLLL